MTRRLRLAWHVCRSVSYYTILHDWVIKWFQTRWQKCTAFKTHEKCGRPDFPLWLCHSRKSLAASPLASRGTKKVPRTPESRQLCRLHRGIFVWTAWPHRGTFASFPKKLTNARQLPGRRNEYACNWLSHYSARLQVVPHFSSGIVKQAKCESAWKSPHARKGDMQQGGREKWGSPYFSLSPSRVAFSRVGWFSRALVFCSLYYPWGKIRDYSFLTKHRTARFIISSRASIARPAWFPLGYKSIEFGWCPPWRHPE